MLNRSEPLHQKHNMEKSITFFYSIYWFYLKYVQSYCHPYYQFIIIEEIRNQETVIHYSFSFHMVCGKNQTNRLMQKYDENFQWTPPHLFLFKKTLIVQRSNLHVIINILFLTDSVNAYNQSSQLRLRRAPSTTLCVWE